MLPPLDISFLENVGLTLPLLDDGHFAGDPLDARVHPCAGHAVGQHSRPLGHWSRHSNRGTQPGHPHGMHSKIHLSEVWVWTSHIFDTPAAIRPLPISCQCV